MRACFQVCQMVGIFLTVCVISETSACLCRSVCDSAFVVSFWWGECPSVFLWWILSSCFWTLSVTVLRACWCMCVWLGLSLLVFVILPIYMALSHTCVCLCSSACVSLKHPCGFCDTLGLTFLGQYKSVIVHIWWGHCLCDKFWQCVWQGHFCVIVTW